MTGRRGALDVTPYGWLLCSVAGSVAGAAARWQYGREAPPRLVGAATFLLAGAPFGWQTLRAGPRTGAPERRHWGADSLLLLAVLMHAAFTGGRALLGPAWTTAADAVLWYGPFALALWAAVAALALADPSVVWAGSRQGTALT
jgi:hypothetical protein